MKFPCDVSFTMSKMSDFGPVFPMFYAAFLINPAVRPVTFMSWFYSDTLSESSRPTYEFFIAINILSILTVFYDNRTSQMTFSGNTSFT